MQLGESCTKIKRFKFDLPAQREGKKRGVGEPVKSGDYKACDVKSTVLELQKNYRYKNSS